MRLASAAIVTSLGSLSIWMVGPDGRRSYGSLLTLASAASLDDKRPRLSGGNRPGVITVRIDGFLNRRRLTHYPLLLCVTWIVCAIGLILGDFPFDAFDKLIACRDRWSGIVLGIGVFKPQLFILMPVFMLIDRRWSALVAWLATAAGLALVSVWIVGVNGARAYVALLTSKVYEEQLHGELGWKMATVGSLLRSIMPPMLNSGGITTALNLVVLGVGGVLLALIHRRVSRNFRGVEAITVAYAVTVLIAATFAPHAFIYDSVVLALPLMIFLNAFQHSATLRVLVAAAYLVSFTTPLRILALSNVGWPASALIGPWFVVPQLACLFVVYRCMNDNREYPVEPTATISGSTQVAG